MTRASLGLAVALCCLGCDRRHPIGVEIRAAGTPDAASYTVALFEGSVCPDFSAVARGLGEPVAEASFRAGDVRGLGEVRGSGPHVLVALGRDASCVPVSGSCQPFILGEDTTVVVTLSDAVSAGGDPCGATRSCQASLCNDDSASDGGADAGVDGGVPEAGVDGGVDAGVDSGLDSGPESRCTMTSDCGDPSLVDCDDGECVLVAPSEVEPLENVFPGRVTLSTVLHLEATTDAANHVHIGLRQARADGDGATILSLPRATFLDRGTAVRTDLPPLAGGGTSASIAIRADAAVLHWSVAGAESPITDQAIWVGTVDTPGTLATNPRLSGGSAMQRGLGPQVTLGGLGVPIRHVTVERDETVSQLQAGSIPANPMQEDYLPWATGDGAPGGGEQYGAGDGRLVVMEFLEPHMLAVWRPHPDDPYQGEVELPLGSTGPLSLAHLGGSRYLLAHPLGDAVRLAATDCPGECAFDEETRVDSAGTLTALALESTPGSGALLVEALERSGDSVLTVRPVGALPGSVGAPHEIYSTPASERITGLAALRLDSGAGHELLLAAYVQLRSGGDGRLALIRVEFVPPS